LVASELTAYWAIGAGIFITLILVTTVRNLWGWLTGLALLGILYLVLESSGFITNQILSGPSLTTSNNLLVNSILLVSAFNVGSALEYSIRCLRPRNPNSDEFRFAKALFLPVKVAGLLIIGIQICLVWIGLSYLLGWPSVLEIGSFI